MSVLETPAMFALKLLQQAREMASEDGIVCSVIRYEKEHTTLGVRSHSKPEIVITRSKNTFVYKFQADTCMKSMEVGAEFVVKQVKQAVKDSVRNAGLISISMEFDCGDEDF